MSQCIDCFSAYRKITEFTYDYGITIDYSQYKKIKKNYEESLKKHGARSDIDLSGRAKIGSGLR